MNRLKTILENGDAYNNKKQFSRAIAEYRQALDIVYSKRYINRHRDSIEWAHIQFKIHLAKLEVLITMQSDSDQMNHEWRALAYSIEDNILQEIQKVIHLQNNINTKYLNAVCDYSLYLIFLILKKISDKCEDEISLEKRYFSNYFDGNNNIIKGYQNAY